MPAYTITSPNASDIVELFRPSRFDGHVMAYRRAKWLADTAADYALRHQAVQALAAEICARAKAKRCPSMRQTVEAV